MNKIPPAIQACLWSYDIDTLDIEQDKELIIRNVLNYGTYEAAQWLRGVYPEHELADVIRHTSVSAWSPKSLNYWSIMCNATPERTGRFS